MEVILRLKKKKQKLTEKLRVNEIRISFYFCSLITSSSLSIKTSYFRRTQFSALKAIFTAGVSGTNVYSAVVNKKKVEEFK